MRAIFVLSILIILIAGFGMFASAYDKNNGNTKEAISYLVNWQKISYLNSVTEETSYTKTSQKYLKQTVGYNYILLIGFFLFNISLCVLAQEYYALKKENKKSKMLKLLRVLIYLQLIGLVCGFLQNNVLDNIVNEIASNTGFFYKLIVFLKYLLLGLGFLIGAYAYIHSKYIYTGKQQEYKQYTADYVKRLMSK